MFAVQMVSGIARALCYLHPNVIHSDLKPSNVLLHEEDGTIVPKIADFGISKVKVGVIAVFHLREL